MLEGAPMAIIEGTSRSNASVLVSDPRGAFYDVPVAMLKSFQAAPERRAQLLAEMRRAAPGRPVRPPDVVDDQPIYELTAERLAPYRLDDEQGRVIQEQLQAAAGGEVQGYDFTNLAMGQFAGGFGLPGGGYAPLNQVPVSPMTAPGSGDHHVVIAIIAILIG